MSATAPTPKASVQQAKTTYISWGDYDFQLVGENTFRPALTPADKTTVKTNVKTYNDYSPNDSMEDMTIRVLYDPTDWAALKALKEAGTINTLETSDGFSAPAMISEMAEVRSDISAPIEGMEITFGFPTQEETSSTTNSQSDT